VSSSTAHRPLLRLAHGIRDVRSGRTGAHRRLRHHLTSIIAATLVMDAIGTFLMFMFERDAPGTQITNVGDSLFWVTAQLLTISSQMSAPLTTGGRIMDIVLMTYAMTVVTALAGSFGAFFFHTRES
jgi:voltage-gated potassium channel